MNEFLNSVKDDLLDVRLRLVLVALGVALAAAVAYAVLGGSSSSSTPTASTAPLSTGVAGISISQITTNSAEPVTETTGGVAQKRGGPLRNPFVPLATAKSASTTTPSSSTPSSSTPSTSTSGASTGTTPSAGTTTPAPATKPTTPAKPKVTTQFKVTAQFGVLPAPSIVGAPAEPAQLKTYANMALNEPLPDRTNPQLVYSGAVKRTKLEAVFTLTGESILHGNATCLPSATQCQAIRLQVGQSETLESIESDGSPVTYELRLIGIEKITRTVSSASAARADTALARESKAGRELLAQKGLTKVSGLEYSPSQGVLVPETPPAASARARVAVQPGHPGH
jgi:hypothetical protein